MGRRNSQMVSIAASTRCPVLDRVRRMRAWRFRRASVARASSAPPLAWPPDSLTRLLMDADGVTEGELSGLLRRVAAARSGD
jgi:hypothetical protein